MWHIISLSVQKPPPQTKTTVNKNLTTRLECILIVVGQELYAGKCDVLL